LPVTGMGWPGTSRVAVCVSFEHCLQYSGRAVREDVHDPDLIVRERVLPEVVEHADRLGPDSG